MFDRVCAHTRVALSTLVQNQEATPVGWTRLHFLPIVDHLTFLCQFLVSDTFPSVVPVVPLHFFSLFIYWASILLLCWFQTPPPPPHTPPNPLIFCLPSVLCLNPLFAPSSVLVSPLLPHPLLSSPYSICSVYLQADFLCLNPSFVLYCTLPAYVHERYRFAESG